MSLLALIRASEEHPSRLCAAVPLIVRICLVLSMPLTAHAGDILRGGRSAGPAPGPSNGSGAPPIAAPEGAQARDTLARTSQALDSVKAMQSAARDIAIRGPNNLGLNPNAPAPQLLPNVPNGLTTGGLQIAPGAPQNPSLWQGARLPTQSVNNGRTNVEVKQTDQQALLTWETFNIGKETTLRFDQTAGGANQNQWTAFNKINDPSGAPSQILGSLEAGGQVFVINQNGIIFGGSSQVNLHSLVASSLPINDNLVERGLLNNPDYQFLFTQLPQEAGTNGTPAYNPPSPMTPSGRNGDVMVQPGALLTSPTTSDNVGGRIALFGPNVTNAGTISTADGQTILGAGLQIGLLAHSATDPSLRGLDLYVGEVGEYGGTATNSGIIDVPRGNVTIGGRDVNQDGAIASTTSVSLNGRIDLLGVYDTRKIIVQGQPRFSPTSSGTLRLGEGSVTQVVPDFDSDETVVGTQLALNSQLNLQALAIHLGRDSILFGPSATAALSAGRWIPSPEGFSFGYTDGQVYLDRGALIDVSGSEDVSASVTDNIISVELRGSELADSPLQREGPLRGQTINIDIRQTGTYNGRTWIGTPLGDVTGFVNLVQRDVGQLTTGGGTVSINAGNSVVLQPGAGIDVSGGWIDYEGGVVETTKLIADGRIFDIAEATPDRVYDGIYTGFTEANPKFNIFDTTSTTMVTGAQFEPGYIQGGNGGRVSITAPSMALDGTLRGNTIAGPRQRITPPTQSALSLIFQGQDATPPLFQPNSPTPPNIVFQNGATQTPAEPFSLDSNGNPAPLRSDRVAEVMLSPDLINANGFGAFRIDNFDGNITVPADVALTSAAGGSFTLAGANINVEGNIAVPGGTISLSVFNYSPYALFTLRNTPGSTTPAEDPNRGFFTLGSAASLSTAGLRVDDRPGSPTRETLPFLTNGGAITINTFNADLLAGSVIDASSGVTVNALARQTFGNGGSIAISAGQDPNIPSLLGGDLRLESTLLGYSGRRGASLNILAPLVQIGGTTERADTLLLSPAFFETGGFASYTLRGIGAATESSEEYIPGVYVAPGTVIRPTAQSWLALPNVGSEIALAPALQPEGVRAPASLALQATGVIDAFTRLLVVRGDVLVDERSSIETDARANVTFRGDTVAALGSVIAPGGNISITGARSFPSLDPNPQNARPTVDLGPQSFFSTAGKTVLTPDPRGFRTGFVTPGGNISVSGNIVAERGSRLDVSGTSGLLDLAPGFTRRSIFGPTELPLVETRVDTNAGTITFAGAQELFMDATLAGRAGGPSALGGNLLISSGRFYAQEIADPRDTTLVVTQSGPTIPAAFYGPGDNAVGNAPRDRNGNVIRGRGYFAADSFLGSGFDSLTLEGTVEFLGPVTINAQRSLSVSDGGVLLANDAVNLSASYVRLGQAFVAPVQPQQEVSPFTKQDQTGSDAPFFFSPTFGPGSLTVTADLIDIGTLSLQNIGRANFIARGGDIRGNGTLNIAGDLSLTAGQIYAPTASAFNILAYDYSSGGTNRPGSITIAAAGDRRLPLSAGSELNIYASQITQGGVLRAPIGEINIGWDGTGTAPFRDPVTGDTRPLPTAQQLTLGANSITSVSAVDPATGQPLTIPYGINLNGTSWIDPTGIDITAGGVPTKQINISGASVFTQPGSLVDISGGGDLYAYRFVPGLGGTRDVLGAETSFAVIPGYQQNYAPFAPFNPSSEATNLGGDPGYVNGNLVVGDSVFLQGSAALPAGNYTLLPARYALLPGAVLVTPLATTPNAQIAPQADGATVVPGYRFDNLSAARTAPPLFSSFEIAPAAIVRKRARYDGSLANTFLRERALELETPLSRLPIDAGQLVLAANGAMTIQGAVNSVAPIGGRGGLVDISSPIDILIAGPGAAPRNNTLVLDATQLSAFGAQSLLIGGIRNTSAGAVLDTDQDGDVDTDDERLTAVAVTTRNITIENAGSPLTGTDVILAARERINVANGAELSGSGTVTAPAETLLLGNATVANSGDGVLVRVSADPAATLDRVSVGNSTTPSLIIGSGARITGGSVTLDSTSGTTLDPNAIVSGTAVALNSGQISLQLDNPGALRQTRGLVLTGTALQNVLASVDALSLLSYSSIDIYGTGQVGTVEANGQASVASLALHAAEIRGFNNGGGTVTFNARDVLLDNSAGRTSPGPASAPSGTLQFNAETIRLGINQLNVDQFANVRLDASSGLLVQRTGGFATQTNLSINAPLVTGAAAANYTISAGGALRVDPIANSATSLVTSGLGARLTLQGASVVTESDIRLPSGSLTLRATQGDVVDGALLDVAGTAQTFFDLVKFTDAGQINLIADAGNVRLTPDSVLTVAAHPSGGDAGTLSISAPRGTVALQGSIFGRGETGGSFVLDIGSLPSIAFLSGVLNSASLSQLRSIRVRNGDVLVDGVSNARAFELSADAGAINVTGIIDASGVEGGSISLIADRSVTLQPGSRLSAAGQDFSSAGSGGAIALHTRGNNGGVVDIRAGSIIDLSVASVADAGEFTGTLHLRAPQSPPATDVQIAPINGTIIGASSILVEGYQQYNLTASNGVIDAGVQEAVRANGEAFLGQAGSESPQYRLMFDRLLANNRVLETITVLAPGAELVNTTGDLTLGTATSNASSDWNLGDDRFGPRSAPGVLTMRANNNLVFFNALTDGFTTNQSTAPLLPYNAALPANVQSWSYNLTAGADFTAADVSRVRPLASLAADTGSLILGKDGGQNLAASPGPSGTTASAVNPQGRPSLFQVIRTGTGDIDISLGRDLQLRNQFATIYTAGVQVENPRSLFAPDDFFVPITIKTPHPSQGALGAVQQNYPAQWSMAGGDVTINAGADIARLTRSTSGELVADSSRQLPMNWLYRRGYVDPATGQFGAAGVGDGPEAVNDPAASTTWWIDFSNFFEGIGAFGGGDVTMLAGNNISNVDAVAPTNARMPIGAPDPAKLVELGGGDLIVRAGANLSGGVYYVENGQGTIEAGNSIITNNTRSPSLGIVSSFNTPEIYDPLTWLPTTLFLGKSSFEVSARGSVLLGPVGNPFLLPAGVNNKFWNKSYFTTYGSLASVDVSSLGGAVTLRNAATLPDESTAKPLLQVWMEKQLLLTQTPTTAAYYQPWLRLVETDVSPFSSVANLFAPTLRATSFSRDLNIVGGMDLFPSPLGTIELAAAGAVNALQPTGVSNQLIQGQNTVAWTAARINLSDASPGSVPGIGSPFAYQNIAGRSVSAANTTQTEFLGFVDTLFEESGSTLGRFGVLQTKQALHAPGLLHRDDQNPVRVYATDGDISGLTMFAGKAGRVIAGEDISDIAFYLQNVRESDISLLASGGDIVAFSANSPLRIASQAPGNAVTFGQTNQAGDIQISGPGTLEVLAGRNLDLGVGSNNSNGTGVGITSIGNARNPSLPFEGADVIAGAGIGISNGLSASDLDFSKFIAEFVKGPEGVRYLAAVDSQRVTQSSFDLLPAEEQRRVALEVFYIVLREAGRDRSKPDSAGFGNYDAGFRAIATLFPGIKWNGNINTQARDIRTRNGGDISLFAPGGELALASTVIGNPLAPPGIITESGGDISIFTHEDVSVGISRIFTLRGGDEIIWSSIGDIAAGASSKTVQSAPPTRVLIDPQSGDVQTDLAGLATGGGIGVLNTVAGVPPGDVDLIAPEGTIDAGDAGIRVSGNLNISALVVVNAANISVGGASVGTPTVSAPSLGSLTAASSTTAATNTAADAVQQVSNQGGPQYLPSIITVEVLGYGGGTEDEEDEEERRRRQQRPQANAVRSSASG